MDYFFFLFVIELYHVANHFGDVGSWKLALSWKIRWWGVKHLVLPRDSACDEWFPGSPPVAVPTSNRLEKKDSSESYWGMARKTWYLRRPLKKTTEICHTPGRTSRVFLAPSFFYSMNVSFYRPKHVYKIPFPSEDLRHVLKCVKLDLLRFTVCAAWVFLMPYSNLKAHFSDRILVDANRSSRRICFIPLKKLRASHLPTKERINWSCSRLSGTRYV